MADSDRFNSAALDPTGTTNHAATYQNFIRGSIALALACAFVLVSLAMFGFGQMGKGGVLFFGFGGLLAGLIAILIDLRSGSRTWLLSGLVFVAFAVFTAIMVS